MFCWSVKTFDFSWGKLHERFRASEVFPAKIEPINWPTRNVLLQTRIYFLYGQLYRERLLILWLLMPWLLVSPGHQQSWHWICKELTVSLNKFYSIHVLGWLLKWLNFITAHGSVSNEPSSVTINNQVHMYLKNVSWRNHIEKLTTLWPPEFWPKTNIPSSYFTILMLNCWENTPVWQLCDSCSQKSHWKINHIVTPRILAKNQYSIFIFHYFNAKLLGEYSSLTAVWQLFTQLSNSWPN